MRLLTRTDNAIIWTAKARRSRMKKFMHSNGFRVLLFSKLLDVFGALCPDWRWELPGFAKATVWKWLVLVGSDLSSRLVRFFLHKLETGYLRNETRMDWMKEGHETIFFKQQTAGHLRMSRWPISEANASCGVRVVDRWSWCWVFLRLFFQFIHDW